MRLFFSLNLIAIVILASALAQHYKGTPLPYRLVDTTLVGTAQPPQDALRPAIEPDEGAWLGLPLPNPARLQAGPQPSQSTETAVAPAATLIPTPAGEKLHILTEGAYPPFNYRGDDGTLTGFDIEIAHALCVRLHADCEFATRSWNALLPALKSGAGDAVVASMLIPVRGRAKPPAIEGIIFTHRYYETPGHFVARRGAMTTGTLDDKRIAVQAGTVHKAFVTQRFPRAHLIELPSLAAAESAIAMGNADLLFADRNALLGWLARGKESACCQLVGPDYTDTVYFSDGAGIAVRASDTALRDRLNRVLSELAADGTLARIGTRYFSQNIY